MLLLPVAFGIGFQLPLVMLFLERIGLFTVRGYLKQWRIAVLVIFVVAAILAPPDAYSMLLLAGSLNSPLLWRRSLVQAAAAHAEPVSP